MDLLEELIRADLCKELKRVIDTVGARIFLEVLGRRYVKIPQTAGAEALT